MGMDGREREGDKCQSVSVKIYTRSTELAQGRQGGQGRKLLWKRGMEALGWWV